VEIRWVQLGRTPFLRHMVARFMSHLNRTAAGAQNPFRVDGLGIDAANAADEAPGSSPLDDGLRALEAEFGEVGRRPGGDA
jgi:hypothetical protein